MKDEDIGVVSTLIGLLLPLIGIVVQIFLWGITFSREDTSNFTGCIIICMPVLSILGLFFCARTLILSRDLFWKTISILGLLGNLAWFSLFIFSILMIYLGPSA